MVDHEIQKSTARVLFMLADKLHKGAERDELRNVLTVLEGQCNVIREVLGPEPVATPMPAAAPTEAPAAPVDEPAPVSKRKR